MMDSLEDSMIETESNCSMEEMAAKVESALRKNLHLDERQNGRSDSELESEKDVTQLPGYQSVPSGCPPWKKAMIEKKNLQLEHDAKNAVLSEKWEEERWRDVPEWKRALIIEKEKKKNDENAPMEQERRRREAEMARLNAMPDWKKSLITKKRTDMD